MEYIFVVISLLAAVHAFSYGRWLMKNGGNRFGGYVVYAVVILCLILPVYNIIKAH